MCMCMCMYVGHVGLRNGAAGTQLLSSEPLVVRAEEAECDNFADPQTKYLVGRVWARHLHYTHNLEDEPPPVAAKSSKKVKLDDE